MSGSKALHIKTPLVESRPLSVKSGVRVLLKLENTQPSDSFKLRGIGNHIQKEIARGCTRIVASSGGNAGLAAAYVAKKLDIPITIYTPESTPAKMRDRLTLEAANVVVHGKNWNAANDKALEEAKDPDCAFIHPYDHPNIWEGNASLVEELYEDLNGEAPDLIAVSFGGGGLFCGVVQGLDKVGWSKVPVLVMETVGADCFNKAIKAGKIVYLPDITSIAKSLGSLQAADKAFDYSKTHNILSEVITDKQCIDACLQFADDHRFLVEPACGAAITPFYVDLIEGLVSEGKLKAVKTAVVIVCGGHGVNYEMLQKWKKQVYETS